MNYYELSRNATGMCTLAFDVVAKGRLRASNVNLYEIKTLDGHEHYLWGAGFDTEFPSCCNAFADEYEEHIILANAVTVKKIVPNTDVFCYCGEPYYLYKSVIGHSVIRQFEGFFTQDMALKAMSVDETEIESIWLANFYNLTGKSLEYVLTCWGVATEDNFNYLGLFCDDRNEELLPPECYCIKEIPVGKMIVNGNKIYQVREDENRRLYVDLHKVFRLEQGNKKQKAEVATKFEEYKPKECKIIPLVQRGRN